MFKKFMVKEESQNIENYEPKEFSLRITPEAESFERSQLKKNSPFVIDQSSADKSGLSYLKDKRIENEISQKVEKQLIKEREVIFEEYQKKGFEQGLQEGQKQGKDSIIEEFRGTVDSSLQRLNQVVGEVQSFKKNLIQNNESDMIELIQLSVNKICLKEIEIDEDFTKNLIQKTLTENTNEEKLEILLSQKDHDSLQDFISQLKKQTLPQTISFVVSEELDNGGVVLNSDKGKVDKSLKTRFESIWSALKQENG